MAELTPQQDLARQRAQARIRARARIQQQNEARQRALPPPPPASAPDAYVSRFQAQASPQAARAREENLTRNYSPFGAGVAQVSQGVTFGFGDEIEGGLNALVSGASEALQGRFGNVAPAASRAYEDTVDTTRAFVERGRREQPVASFINEAGGGLIIPGGAARASSSMPGLWGQTVRAASGGALGGYAYGFGSNEGDLGDRAQAGNEAAAWGAGIGAALPSAARGANAAWQGIGRPALQNVQNLARQIPTPAPNSVGMSGGNLGARPSGALRPPPPPAPPAAQPPREAVPEGAVNFIDRMRRRERLSIDDLGSAFEQAREMPQGQTVVDLFGDTGTRTLRPIVQGPGETSRLAQDTARTRFAEAPRQIMDALRRGLGVGESRVQAMSRLNDDYQRMSAELYQPIWNNQLSSAQRSALETQTANLMNAPIMRSAIRRADELFANDDALGIVQGGVDDHMGRWYHYVKMGLDDVVSAGRRDGSIAANGLRQAMEAKTQLVRAMDTNIPGYREARSQWAGVAAAEDALDEGASFLRMNPEEVQGRIQQMTPFELDHARIGLADEIRTATRGAVNRNRNVAIVLDDPDIQRTIAAAFDSPQQAAEFMSLVNGSGTGAPGLYRLMDNATQWRGGSSTFANAMHGADEGLHAAAEATGRTATGDFVGAARGLLGRGANMISMGMAERANNIRGAAALRRIDNQEARAFTDEVIRLLREREAADLAARQAGVIAAPAAGAAQARNQ